MAAQPQGVLANNNNTDNNKAQQDERFDRIERDLTRLTLIVQKLADQQQPPQPAAAPAAKASVDSIPPGPIPNSVRAPRFSGVQQVSAPSSNTAIGR